MDNILLLTARPPHEPNPERGCVEDQPQSGFELLKALRLVPLHPAHSRAPVQGFNARIFRGMLIGDPFTGAFPVVLIGSRCQLQDNVRGN